MRVHCQGSAATQPATGAYATQTISVGSSHASGTGTVHTEDSRHWKSFRRHWQAPQQGRDSGSEMEDGNQYRSAHGTGATQLTFHTYPALSWNVLLREPSGDRLARPCRHTGPDVTIKTGMKERIAKTHSIAICAEHFKGHFQTTIACPEIKQKQAQDRKTHIETLFLPFAEILSHVARLCHTKSNGTMLE